MSKLPEFMKLGYRPNGPGRIFCQYCNRTISSNALARSSHERSKAHNEAVDKYRQRRHQSLMKNMVKICEFCKIRVARKVRINAKTHYYCTTCWRT